MKKSCLLLLFTVLISFTVFAQNVGIGTAAPNASSQLDITSTSKGLLIPRMSTSAITSISNPAKGLMVYDSLKSLLMVNTGTPLSPNWQPVAANTNSGWNLTGNNGTNPNNQFLGNTDNKPLRFRVNNTWAGELNPVSGNVLLGLRAGQSNTTGYSKVALGTDALKLDMDGTNLVAIGDSALYNNGTGNGGESVQFDVAVGTKALYSNSIGYNNTAVGAHALYSNTNGIDNTANGYKALYSNTSGFQNTANGDIALYSNTTGYNNTANGYKALYKNTTGIDNTANGLGALYSNTTGGANTAIGADALGSDTSGSENTAIGSDALLSNTTGSQNTANGSSALFFNTTGYSNTANGYQALYSNTTGFNNTANGYQALKENTTGIYNTATGGQALSSNTTGYYNTANGLIALLHNTTGSDNTACGSWALLWNTTGSYNTAIGNNALFNTTTSEYNTAIGYYAGATHDMGYNNTILGANCDVSADGLYNCIAIGQGVICTASSQVTIGNSATNSYRAYANWSNISDGRFKKDLRQDVKGIDFIMKLQPVTYHLDIIGIENTLHKSRKQESTQADAVMKQAIAEKESLRFSGFVAQDVEAAAKESGYDFSGVDKPKNADDFYGLRYSEFVVPLVKAVQEQQAMIDVMKKRIDALEEQNNLLQQLLNKKN